jgi:hypothetical protein
MWEEVKVSLGKCGEDGNCGSYGQSWLPGSYVEAESLTKAADLVLRTTKASALNQLKGPVVCALSLAQKTG